MKPETLGDTIAEQKWLGPAEKALDAAASGTIDRGGQSIRNFLHGTWLGHPLHPAITDVPVGAWTAGAVMDLTETFGGSTKYRAGADACVRIGLIGAVGSAVTGLTDWERSGKKGRRIGALHALFNISATALYTASWLLRRRGNRSAGIATGMTGWALMLCGAYLGGHLTYDQRIGVDHAQRVRKPGDWTPVMPERELGEGQMHKVTANGIHILIARREGRLFAIGEKCSHLGGPLSEGEMIGDTVRCPWHGSRFSLESGKVIDGPAVYDMPCFELRVENGQIEVRANPH